MARNWPVRRAVAGSGAGTHLRRRPLPPRVSAPPATAPGAVHPRCRARCDRSSPRAAFRIGPRRRHLPNCRGIGSHEANHCQQRAAIAARWSEVLLRFASIRRFHVPRSRSPAAVELGRRTCRSSAEHASSGHGKPSETAPADRAPSGLQPVGCRIERTVFRERALRYDRARPIAAAVREQRPSSQRRWGSFGSLRAVMATASRARAIIRRQSLSATASAGATQEPPTANTFGKAR